MLMSYSVFYAARLPFILDITDGDLDIDFNRHAMQYTQLIHDRIASRNMVNISLSFVAIAV